MIESSQGRDGKVAKTRRQNKVLGKVLGAKKQTPAP
jgi:hypothetical protein